MDKQLRADITETILRRAATTAYEQEMAEFINSAEKAEPIITSKAHDARMRALFKREERKESLNKLYVIAKRAAIVVLISATMLFGALLTDGHIQATVRDTIVQWHERFTRFEFRGNGYEVGKSEWFPDFMPEGFMIDRIYEFYTGRLIFLEHDDGNYVIFGYEPAADIVIGVDNEFTEMEIISHFGVDYFVITPLPESEHRSQVIWQMEGYAFTLLSHLDSETLFQMALSVSS
ncbi:MAG: DUF4367 domain-containing protein [Defluviitaleaceae bacterium]|nr:DUF4367 domain-containing protein [Defluviitaleaceae bacterium]